MSITVLLLLLAAGALIIPTFGDDDDDSSSNDDKNEILGGPENDNIEGTSGNDLIRTFLGDDTIDGGAGNDEIRAGDGEDFVEGGTGLDFIRGGAGNDEIYGNEGDDRIIADRGNDFVDAGIGSDIVRGGEGNDLILGGVDSTLDENDQPIGRFGATDQLFGEDGDDLMVAWGTGSSINGGTNDADAPDNATNDDTMVAASGDVVMEGRDGDNTAIALANLEDDQGSRATVLDFDTEDDTLVLTVDYTTTGAIPVGFEPDFTVAFTAETSETQGAGTVVRITWDNPDELGGETTSESAQAFLVSLTPEDLDGTNGSLNLEVYLTEEASYADPLGTLDDLGLLPEGLTLPT